MTERARRFLFLAIGVCALAAVGAGFFARKPIERALFVRAVRDATGISLDADSIFRAGDGYEVFGLRASARGGAAFVAAPRAYVLLADRRLSLSLDRPHIFFDPNRGPGVGRLLGTRRSICTSKTER